MAQKSAFFLPLPSFGGEVMRCAIAAGAEILFGRERRVGGGGVSAAAWRALWRAKRLRLGVHDPGGQIHPAVAAYHRQIASPSRG